jgi:catechol 2,3-dioxygenase-like lactoylglutathione lyase family enzyme
MSLHGLVSVTIGVPNVDETAAYYTDFGLAPDGGGWFSTTDAGRQLRIVPAPTRRLVEMRVGVDEPDDLARRRQPGAPRRLAEPGRDEPGDRRAGHRHPGLPGRRAADPAAAGGRGALQRARPYGPPGHPGAGILPAGPGAPASFLHPEDLAAMMTGAHAPR